MIRKNAKVFALVLAIVMMLSTAAFAAEGDHFVNGKLKYSANQVRADVSAKNHVRVAPSEFQIEVEGKLYDLADANAAYAEDKANWKEILKGEDPSEDLKVVEVSAIEAITVTVGDDVDLPETVEVTLNDGNEEEEIEATVVEVAVEWEEFVAEEEGEFIVNGTIVLPEDAEFTISEELAAVTVTVVVEEAALEVVEVSAITGQMLPVGDDEAELKFLVNGKEELTATEFDEKYGEEDYTVAYKYNFNEALNTKEAGTYKYAVEVTDAEGNKLPEGGVVAADFVDFKLVDATKAVKVNTLGLFKGDEAWENATVMTSDNVSIKAAIYENELGQKNTDKDEDGNTVVDINEPIIKEIKSSDPLTAYYDGEKIVARKDGEVTFTVVFDDAKLEVLQKTVKVTTKEKQTVTTIEAEDLKVQKDAVVTFDIKYFDQDGEEVRGEVESFYTATLAGKEEAGTATLVAPHTFTEEGNYVVKVYAEANKKTELGSFNVRVVSVDGNPDAYELEIPKDDGKTVELILNVDPNADGYNKTMNLIVKAFIEEVAVELPAEGVVYEVKSSNEDVLTVGELDRVEGTITVTAVKEGTATVTLYTVEGALKEEVASIELEVKNTTAQINNLTLAKDVKTLDVVKSEDGTWDVYNLDQLVSSDLKENETIEGKIAEVVFSKNDGKAIVIIEDIYGGKEFVFNAREVFKVEGLSVDPEELTLTVGYEGEITATVSPANATYKDVTWKSSNEAVATVENGLVKAVAKGTAEITATTVDGEFKATTTVKVLTGRIVATNADTETETEYESIQAAIVDAERGNNIMKVYPGNYGTDPIEIIQQESVDITLEAVGEVVLKNQIKIDGAGRSNGAESLTIKGFTFDFSDATGDIIATAKIDSTNYVYAHNIFIEDCVFIGNSDNVVAVRASAQGGHYNFRLKGCTGTNLHSLAQLTSVTGVKVQDCNVIDAIEGGLNLQNSTNIVIDNLTVDGTEYGVRAGQGSGTVNTLNTMTISDSELNAKYPIWLRGDAPGTVIITDSTLTPSDDGVMIYNVAGTVNITIDGATYVTTEEELKTALANTSVSAITLGNDIELSDWVVIGRPVKLDGNNKTIFGVKNNNGPVLHLQSDNIEIKHVTIKSKVFNSAITAGINIANGEHTGIVIDDVTFENTRYGVYANPQSYVTITNNIFKNLNSGIGIEGYGKIEANEFSEIKNNYVENASKNISSDSIIANNNFDTTPSIEPFTNGANIKPAQ